MSSDEGPQAALHRHRGHWTLRRPGAGGRVPRPADARAGSGEGPGAACVSRPRTNGGLGASIESSTGRVPAIVTGGGADLRTEVGDILEPHPGRDSGRLRRCGIPTRGAPRCRLWAGQQTASSTAQAASIGLALEDGFADGSAQGDPGGPCRQAASVSSRSRSRAHAWSGPWSLATRQVRRQAAPVWTLGRGTLGTRASRRQNGGLGSTGATSSPPSTT
jgi:hypothetical protein